MNVKQETLSKILMRKNKINLTKKIVPKRWLYPIGQERDYHRILNRLVVHLRKLINEELIPQIPNMINEVQGKISTDRTDDFLDQLRGIILHLNLSMQSEVEKAILLADENAIKINNFNKNQFAKMHEQVFGINPFEKEPWLIDQLKIFSAQNSDLIKSLPAQELNRVSGIIERGLQEGQTYSNVAKEIKKSFGITQRRAKLIARDQTKKLNTSLTKLRQQEIGVEEYIWQTSGDERVRGSHAVLDGKKCRWDDASVFYDEKSKKWLKKSTIGAEPLAVGMAINCRCTPLAVLDNILDLG